MAIAIIRYGAGENLISAEVDIEEFARETRAGVSDIRALTWAWGSSQRAVTKMFVARDTEGRTLVIAPDKIVSIETKEANPPGATSS